MFARRHHLGQAQRLLGWDQQVLMPEGASEARSETLAELAVLSHEMLTAQETSEQLDAAERAGVEAEQDNAAGEIAMDAPDTVWRAANLREMRRLHAHASAAPAALVAALSKAEAKGDMAWRSARAEDDFPALIPALTEIVALQREAAAAKGEALGLAPYDALLDQYEPGARAARIDALFAELAAFLPDFTEDVLARQAARPTAPPLPGPFPIERQRQLAERLMAALGFDGARGRLDVSLHPFCGGADDDIRITTRYAEADFTSALMGVLHETGHALYEQGLPAAWRAQPVGRSRGMALHESQSLFVEMQICRSRAFLSFAAPQFREAFGAAPEDPAWSVDAFAARAHRVERGLIRVDADEVTYPAHVILRYRLERALIAGDLAVADLPGAWAEQMEALVGVRPPEDRTGCLQDIHWPSGAFGYFPTYTLGALAAAQLREAAEAALPTLWDDVASGDFAALLGWLRGAVHGVASLGGDSDAILRQATGAPLGVDAFRRHLEQRYGPDAAAGSP
ncbi:MAG: carboxypeptidase M32 [Pseudomonadota bacterium]